MHLLAHMLFLLYLKSYIQYINTQEKNGCFALIGARQYRVIQPYWQISIDNHMSVHL